MTASDSLRNVRVVLLCGGLGTRMREETEFRPKPMVEVGGRPLLWHIMRLYHAHGLREFVLCLGYRGEMIKRFFADYRLMGSNVVVDLKEGSVEYERTAVEDWRISLIDTGPESMTGARVKRVEPYLGDEELFLCTYGDGLADVDISALIDFHRSHGKLATVTSVHPPSRFGQLVVEGDEVRRFAEKPQAEEGRINGGFFVFDKRVLQRLSTDPSCILEREPLEQLAADGELRVFEHDGFWQCADTLRDVELLRGLWDSGNAPWRVWDDRIGAAGANRGRRSLDRDEAPREPLAEAS